MDKLIEIRDVGPIESLAFDLSGRGGVAVVRGRNGSGKSHAIRAVAALSDRSLRAKLESRDGSGRGTVEGLGASIAVGKRTMLVGELEARVVDGEDPSALVDPGFEKPEVADEHRLRALCRIARVGLDVAAFEALVGGQDALRAIAKPATLACPDLVGFAEALRRDLHAAARAEESAAENDGARAAGVLDNIKDVDLSAEHDAFKLGAAVDEAGKALAVARERQRSQLDAMSAAARARNALRDAQAGAGDVVDRDARIAALREEDVALQGAHDECRSKIVEAEAVLLAAKDALGRVVARRRGISESIDAEQRLKDADARNASTIAEWRRQVDAAAIPDADMVTDAKLADLSAAYERAKAADRNGEVVRRALEQNIAADALATSHRERKRKAERLRATAKGVDEIVSEAIRKAAPCGVGVVDGRMTVQTDRGRELFASLSDGERWRIACDVLFASIEPGSVFPLAQPAWEGLDPANRAAIVARAAERGVWGITGEADDGDLRVEVLSPADELAEGGDGRR